MKIVTKKETEVLALLSCALIITHNAPNLAKFLCQLSLIKV